MASKSKNKLKSHKIIFGENCIDLKRFAYDVIVYSAKKFGVPDNCICIWEGSDNDYGYQDFCEVVFRLTVKHQILSRHIMYQRFNSRYELNKLESFKTIGFLYQDVFKEATGLSITLFNDLVISLSVASELILFLYSKSSRLYLRQMAGYWFDCYFHLEVKSFKKGGGLDKLYRMGRMPVVERLGEFWEKFIEDNCQSYEGSAKNEKLAEKLLNEVSELEREIEGGEDSEIARFIQECLMEVFMNPLASTLDEASRINLPIDPRLGIIPHEELLKDDPPLIAGATSSPNLPAANLQKSTTPRKRSSVLPKRRQRHSTSRSSLDQGRGQLSSDTSKQSSGEKPRVSVADDKTSFQNLPSSSRQDLPMNRRGFSDQQESTFSEYTIMEENLEKLSLVFTRAKQSSGEKPRVSVADDKTSSQNLPSSSRQDLPMNRSGFSDQQESTSSECTSME